MLIVISACIFRSEHGRCWADWSRADWKSSKLFGSHQQWRRQVIVREGPQRTPVHLGWSDAEPMCSGRSVSAIPSTAASRTGSIRTALRTTDAGLLSAAGGIRDCDVLQRGYGRASASSGDDGGRRSAAAAAWSGHRACPVVRWTHRAGVYRHVLLQLRSRLRCIRPCQ